MPQPVSVTSNTSHLSGVDVLDSCAPFPWMSCLQGHRKCVIVLSAAF